MRLLSRASGKAIVALWAGACVLAATSPAVSAAEHNRSFIINGIATVSISRPAAPQAQRVIRLFSTGTAPWGNSTCRDDSADVSMDDWHIFSVALAAWKNKTPVSVTVESTEFIDTGDVVCRVIALHALQPPQ